MRRHGFTLIELLIVVAIIAILAAIAVPNFLEAQTRAKISRAKADHRTIATGLETYQIDNNVFPLGNWQSWALTFGATEPRMLPTLAPVLGLLSGMVFLVKAGMLNGVFYVQAAALFLTALAMAAWPSFGHTIFGVVSALCFLIPGWKYYQQRRTRN